ncbi:nuclease-related domain-containing protein [Actinomyces vulturis]|uniref:nuclease-related domain-containing protein n=1 Tax=Actinomyces vulturis TaxID=1857645 RepID=UPI00083572E7|nr:nuclease-related domain-containing protein [Actinomyces vulturis]
MSIYGRPGSNLDSFEGHGQLARSIGASAERDTAAIIDDLSVERENDILHSVPIASGKADIDHIVVGSKGVFVIDTKKWKPGWYFSIGSKCFRICSGKIERFKAGESHSLSRSIESMRTKEIPVRGSAVVVWPSNSRGKCHTLFMRYPGGIKVIKPSALKPRVSRTVGKKSNYITVARIKVWASYGSEKATTSR